jgi:hypothetical protein
MGRGDLRNEVSKRFGDFLSSEQLVETNYEYDQATFGNELLELANDKNRILFVRDRSQISIDIGGKCGPYQHIHLLLERLGIESPKFNGNWIPQPGFLYGAEYLVSHWQKLVTLVD